MNLVWFLTVGVILSLILGEFGQFPFASSTSISITDILLSLAVGFLFIWNIAIKKDLKFFNSLKKIAPFLVVATISLFISSNFSGGLYLIRFILYSLTIVLGYSLIKMKKVELSSILSLIIFVGSILAAIGFFQLLIYPDLEQLSLLGYDPHQNRLVSTFLDPNFIGAFLALSVVFIVERWLKQKRKLYLILFALFLSAIFLTFSRSAYLMVLIELFLYFLIQSKKLLLLGIIMLIIIYFLVPQFAKRIEGGFLVDASAKERLESWQKGLFIYSKNPILGVGFNNIRDAFSKYELNKVFSSNGGNSGSGIDSSFIFILATTGTVGFMSYLFFWLSAFWLILKQIKQKKEYAFAFLCVLIGLIINSQFVNSLFYPPIIVTIVLLLGAFYAMED